MTKKVHAPAAGSNVGHLFARLGQIEWRNPADLIAYAGNPRVHSDKQLTKMAAAIREFGFLVPVLLSADDEIVAGEARVEVAKRLGLDAIPTTKAHHLTKAQIRAVRLAENRMSDLGSWDEHKLAIELAQIIELDNSEFSIEVLGCVKPNVLAGKKRRVGLLYAPRSQASLAVPLFQLVA